MCKIAFYKKYKKYSFIQVQNFIQIFRAVSAINLQKSLVQIDEIIRWGRWAETNTIVRVLESEGDAPVLDTPPVSVLQRGKRDGSGGRKWRLLEWDFRFEIERARQSRLAARPGTELRAPGDDGEAAECLSRTRRRSCRRRGRGTLGRYVVQVCIYKVYMYIN